MTPELLAKYIVEVGGSIIFIVVVGYFIFSMCGIFDK